MKSKEGFKNLKINRKLNLTLCFPAIICQNVSNVRPLRIIIIKYLII